MRSRVGASTSTAVSAGTGPPVALRIRNPQSEVYPPPVSLCSRGRKLSSSTSGGRGTRKSMTTLRRGGSIQALRGRSGCQRSPSTVTRRMRDLGDLFAKPPFAIRRQMNRRAMAGRAPAIERARDHVMRAHHDDPRVGIGRHELRLARRSQGLIREHADLILLPG